MPAEPESRRGPLLALVCALALSAAHFSTFDIADVPILTDTRYYIYFAWRIAEGAVPHLDLFDNKTQLASFVGALFHATGEGLGADPLMAMRAGYLALAALGGVLAYGVHRRLFPHGPLQGWLGLLAYLSFGFVGTLVAIGPVPKLLMFLCACASALLVQRRRWFAAGTLGALAFMDWQIGALVWLCALVTALSCERPRARACLRLALGGLAGVAPFLVYYAYHGALDDAFQQTVVASFSRGSQELESTGFADRLRSIALLSELYMPGRTFLLALAGLGVLIGAAGLWFLRGSDRLRLLLPLFLYHSGVVSFSLLDFQWQGDFLLLLFSVSFFLGLFWNAAALLLARALAGRAPRTGLVAGGALLALALFVARPAWLRPDLPLYPVRFEQGLSVQDIRDFDRVTLTDQKQVAAQVRAIVGDRPALYFQRAELYFLTDHPGRFPLIYWNGAAWSHYRTSPEESMQDTFRRIVETQAPFALYRPAVPDQRAPRILLGRIHRLRSEAGRYNTNLHTRS